METYQSSHHDDFEDHVLFTKEIPIRKNKERCQPKAYMESNYSD